jgi:hypothetical protein
VRIDGNLFSQLPSATPAGLPSYRLTNRQRRCDRQKKRQRTYRN